MMKRHLSVLTLAARGIAIPLLGLLTALGLVQTALFLRALNTLSAQGPVYLETVFQSAAPGRVLAAVFVLTCALLCANGCAPGSRTEYTLQRLRISRPALFLWYSGCHALALLLLWAAQVGIAVGLSALYTARTGGWAGPQEVLLTFYSHPLLHALLPLEAPGLWVRNLLLCLELGLVTARFSFGQRRSRPFWAAALPVLVTALTYPVGLGESGALRAPLVGAAVAAARVYTVFVPREED